MGIAGKGPRSFLDRNLVLEYNFQEALEGKTKYPMLLLLPQHTLEKYLEEKLEKLNQGNKPAKEFFQEFESLVTQAGFEKEDKHILTLIRKNTRQEIIDKIYNGETLPTTYDEWKDKTKRHDTNRITRELEKKNFASGAKAPYTPPSNRSTLTLSSNEGGNTKSASGTTYGG